MKPLNDSPFVVTQLWTARPSSDHRLLVTSGRAWATLSGEWDKDNPDHVLLCGDGLHVAAGQHLVVEAWPRHPAEVLTLTWLAIDKSEIEVKTDSVSSPGGVTCL